MWRLLEARVRGRLGRLGAALAIGALLALYLVVSKGGFADRPSLILVSFGGLVLTAVLFDLRRREVDDRVDRREALHRTLPLSPRRLALGMVLESNVALATVVALFGAVFLVAGPLGWLGPGGAWREDLLLFVGIGLWVMAFEAMNVTSQEIRILFCRLGLTWLFWVLLVVLFGGLGGIIGSVVGDGRLGPLLIYAVFTEAWNLVIAVVLVLLFGALSASLFLHRDADLTGLGH